MERIDKSNNSLPREERLRGRGAVSNLFAEGHSGFVYPIRYLWREAVTEGAAGKNPRVIFTVPKRLHKRANKRNLLRRRIKEAYRLQKGVLISDVKDIDIALVYSTKEVLEYDKISKAMGKILSQIAEREQ